MENGKIHLCRIDPFLVHLNLPGLNYFNKLLINSCAKGFNDFVC